MLIAPLLLTLAPQTPSTSATTLADLVPKNTVAYLQAPSLDRAAKLFDRLRNTLAPAGGQTVDVVTLLQLLGVPGDAAEVDRARPVGVCLVLDETAGAEPLPVFLVPVRDADKFLKSLSQGGRPAQGIAQGGYACVGMLAAPELPSAPAPIAQGLLAGELAARFDLGRVIERFREPLDNTLDGIETEGAASAAVAGGIDPAPVFGAYVDFLRDVVDSAETLDLALNLDGDEAELDFAFATAEGSALAAFGSKEKTGLRALAPLLDAESSLSMLIGTNGGELMKHFQPLFDSMAAAYPEALRPMMQGMLTRMPEIYRYLGTAQAGSMDFGESGMRYRLYSRGGDPVKLLHAYRSIIGDAPGCAATDVPQREVAGVKIDGVRFQFDIARLAKSTGEGQNAGEDSVHRMLKRMFGEAGLLVQVASKDGTGLMVVGGDDEYLRASLARVSANGAQPAFLARALAQVGDLNPCMVVRYDFGRLLSGVKEMLGDMLPMGTDILPSIALAPTIWGGVDGRIWRGALALNLGELAAVARLQGAPKPVSRDPRAVIPMIMQALDEYAINNGGKYPESLEVLVVPDANGAAYLEGYDGRLPRDPWNNEYHYEPPTKQRPHPRVISYGSDGAPGGTGDAADIDSEALKSKDR